MQKNSYMKKILSLITAIAFIVLFSVSDLHADTGTPGDPPSGPTGGTPIGGGAPIGGGVFILLGLAAAYGGRKLYMKNKEELEE